MERKLRPGSHFIQGFKLHLERKKSVVNYVLGVFFSGRNRVWRVDKSRFIISWELTSGGLLVVEIVSKE